jgi:hypothetical protein
MKWIIEPGDFTIMVGTSSDKTGKHKIDGSKIGVNREGHKATKKHRDFVILCAFVPFVVNTE